MNKKRKPLAVDLFSGAGGFSLAAKNSGFQIQFSIENDKYSCETYRENICKDLDGTLTKLYEEDITTVDPKKLAAEHFSKSRCDLLLGGPPCQGFSTHRILDSGVDDPRNELIISYFDFVKALQPRVFLMENVPGMLWERHKEYLERFFAEGKKAGYHLYQPEVLDARDYGVHQRRRRVFVLGVHADCDRSEFSWPPKPTHVDPRQHKDGVQRSPWVNCADIFKKLPEDDPNNLHMQHGPTLVEVFSRTPKNGGSRKDSGRVLPCHANHDGHKDVYGRINPSEPAPTMTTACINPSKGRFVHPTQNHGITVRQAARIQTFPDDFVFEGGLTAAGRQIGNAVPVDLGTVLIKHIRALLEPRKGSVKTPAKRKKKIAKVHELA